MKFKYRKPLSQKQRELLRRVAGECLSKLEKDATFTGGYVLISEPKGK
jgi:hypothetical protein